MMMRLRQQDDDSTVILLYLFSIVLLSILFIVYQQQQRATAIFNNKQKAANGHYFPIAPGYIPFLGHALSLSNADEFLSILTKWSNQIVGKDDDNDDHGIYEFSLFGKRWIVCCTADTFMEIFRLRPSNKVKRASQMSNAISSLGVEGMFNAEGYHWKNDRRLVGPTLNKNHMKDYFESMKLVTNRLIVKWEKKKMKEEEEDSNNNSVVVSTVVSDLSNYSLDVTALCILGMDFNTVTNPLNNDLANDIESLFKVVFMRALAPVPYWQIPFCSNIDGGRVLAENTLRVFGSLVDDYRKQKEKKKKRLQQDQQVDNKDMHHANGSGEGAVATKTCLQKLIDASDGDDARLDKERVVGNLTTLLLAGTDTTSTTLAVCLWEIANDLVLQEELYQEVTTSGFDMDRLTLKDVMNGFPRLHSLLFEVLRVKGPGSFIFLEPVEPIKFHGRVINPGTCICALTRSLGEKAASEVPRGPNGEGAEVFCPRRWLQHSSEGESVTVIQPTNKHGGFMPFGTGVRICPGANFAKVEAITGLFCLLKRFELAPIADHPPLRRVTRFTQTFDSEIQLILKPRQ